MTERLKYESLVKVCPIFSYLNIRHICRYTKHELLLHFKKQPQVLSITLGGFIFTVKYQKTSNNNMEKLSIQLFPYFCHVFPYFEYVRAVLTRKLFKQIKNYDIHYNKIIGLWVHI